MLLRVSSLKKNMSTSESIVGLGLAEAILTTQGPGIYIQKFFKWYLIDFFTVWKGEERLTDVDWSIVATI